MRILITILLWLVRRANFQMSAQLGVARSVDPVLPASLGQGSILPLQGGRHQPLGNPAVLDGGGQPKCICHVQRHSHDSVGHFVRPWRLSFRLGGLLPRIERLRPPPPTWRTVMPYGIGSLQTPA
ncbi:MAG: hypothetical protein R2787_01905 [Saprospiraceae bacterium]